MDKRIASVIILALGLSVNAQTINVRGKVTNAAGNAIANAVVELTHAKLKDTTGADGLYAFNSGGAAVRPFAHPASGSMRLNRGVLEFSVAEAAPIRIGIFDVKGALLDKVTLNRSSAGTYRLNLAGRIHSENLLVIKASIGNQSTVFSYLPMAGVGRKDEGLEHLGPSGSLAKERVFVDTLKATAVGYQTKTFAFTSYDLAQDILLEASANCTPPTPPSAKDSVTLDMAVAEGLPNYLASGFIYGIARDGLQPPTKLLTDIKVQGFRAGRGSGGCGEAGWKGSWKTIMGYYSKAKEMGVPMEMVLSEMWLYECPLPGLNGDWTAFTSFINLVIDSVKANGMTGPDLRWEIWNESDYTPTFWSGTQAQWFETWKRAYQQIRTAIPGAIIEGPSLSSGAGGSYMNAFLDYAKANNVIPDIISWHIAGGGGDPANDAATITRSLSTRGITGVKGFDLNEYGSQTEQNPGHSAWFLARFDRVGIQGLRSNWSTAPGFYANMGNLVTTNWQPNSQYWVYKRYADQTGLRIKTTAGKQVDAVGYQDMAAAKSIIVVGNRGGSTGAVNVVIKNVPSWLQVGGATKVLLEKMPTGTGASSGPTVVSNASATVTCNTLIVTLDWATATDGYALTLSPN